jgi:glucokinase
MQSPVGPDEQTALAVDVGGTKIDVAVVRTDGRILWSGRTPTPLTTEATDEQAEAIWAALRALVDEAVATRRPAVAGVGCGGPMEEGNELVSPLNIPGWRRFPLRRRIEELTGLPTRIDNDAKALALAEGRWGAARDHSCYMSMVVSTGVGGGIVLDGRLLDGRTGNAGHVGHVMVNPGGRICGCGAAGCLEAEASGTAIRAMTGRPPAEALPSVVERTGQMVGRAVASTANLLDLALTTVAGSVALGFGPPFFEAARRELGAAARLSFSRGCRIEPSGLGAEGPILGAAAVGFGPRR